MGFWFAADAPEAERRRKLADWIANRDNPLFARVIVNRLWHHHFGRGLVSTPNDFGFSGGQPTHPELLDYLASRLIESNWSLKSMHRLIVSSATWQQSTSRNAAAEAIDAGNRLLWRGNRTRLDAETLRDSILLASGQLNDTVGGPSYQDFKTFNFNSQFYDMIDPVGEAVQPTNGLSDGDSLGTQSHARCIRLPRPVGDRAQASGHDDADSIIVAAEPFVCAADGRSLCGANCPEAGDEPAAQVDRAVQIAWCRMPTASESDSFVRFAEQHGLAALCRVLFNSNEFLYVD